MIDRARLEILEPISLEALATLLRERAPRVSARPEIEVKPIPIRTAYEILMRLSGPRDAVLDYAALLFAEDAARDVPFAPPLALEEAHAESDGSLSLLLSRGMYTGG